MYRLLSAIALVVMLPLMLSAQRQDIHLSPPEPVSYQLPGEIRIQSAARAGNSALVVWGTTVLASDGSLLNVLRMQGIRDISFVGEQAMLHSAEARPYSFVQVVASEHGYLVFWNDRRAGAEGIYMQRVDTNGQRNGNEERLAVGQVTANGIHVLGDAEKGRLILWYDGRRDTPGVYVRHLNVSGSLDGMPQRIGSTFFGRLVFPSLPGITLIALDNGNSVLVRNDGTIDTRRIPFLSYSDPYVIHADTSLVRLHASTLSFYRSIFDTIPYKEIEIPALDSAVVGTEGVTRDSLGRVRVVFLTVRITGDVVNYNEKRITAYQVTVFDDDSVSAPRQTYVHTAANAGIHDVFCFVWSFKGAQRVQGSANTSSVVLNFEMTEYIHGHQQEPEQGTQTFSINTIGQYVAGDSGFIPIVAGEPVLAVDRISSDTLSKVRITINQKVYECSAPTASYQVNIPQGRAGVTVHGGELLLTWDQGGSGNLFLLNRWSPSISTNDVREFGRLTESRLPPPSPWGQGRAGEEAHEAVYGSSANYYSGNGFSALLTSNYQIVTGSYWMTSASKEYYSYSISTWGAGIATDSGWKQVGAYKRIDPVDGQYIPKQLGFDPNRQELLLFVRLTSYSGLQDRVFYAISADGSISWTISNPVSPDSAQVIPVDSAEYLAVGSNGQVSHINENVVISNFSLPASRPDMIYERLLGRTFLRKYFVDTTHRTLGLELYDIDGVLRDSNRITFDTSVAMPGTVQNQIDSSLVILYAADGVRAVRLDKTLSIIDRDIPVSQTRDKIIRPSGVFRNDTLYCVWEDYRNGVSDIYGTVFKLPTLTVDQLQDITENTRDARVVSVSLAILRIIPNPAVNAMVLEFTQPEANSVVVEYLDMMGRRVASDDIGVWSAGRHTHAFNLTGLAPGSYIVVLRSGSQSSRTRLVVLH